MSKRTLSETIRQRRATLADIKICDAGPEMLEALQNITKASYTQLEDGKLNKAPSHEVIEQALQAIQKATK